LFMAAGATLSLVMNNIAAGAVLLPAAVRAGHDSRVPPSKLLIPLSFGTLVGGMATYFTTANIVLSSILRDHGQARLNMMDFFPTGSLIVLAGLAFMALDGRHLLPDHESMEQAENSDEPDGNLYETYALGERLWEVSVAAASRLVNTALVRSGIGQGLGLTVIGIWRGRRFILDPAPLEVIKPDDCLLVLGRGERVHQMRDWGVEIGRATHRANADPESIELTEIIIPPRSSVVGKSLVDLDFRRKYTVTIAAVWREGRSFRTDVGKMPLEVGDALLVLGPSSAIVSLAQERDFLVLQHDQVYRPLRPQKAGWALLITALVLLISIVEIVPTAEAMMIGAAAMALTGCINLDEAYRAIEWRVVFLIAGLLPISIAMMNTGLAERIGTAVVDAVAPFGGLALAASLYIVTMLITQVIGGQVAALVIGPVAVTSALQLGVNPQAVAVAVAIACSTAFLTPVAHPVNILMMGPGGYTFGDFFKIGSRMSIVTFVAMLVGMVVFWNL
jgi:di/tricarboxylate transporter